jgi:hypothetical protein
MNQAGYRTSGLLSHHNSNQEALKTFVKRIKARQARQTELWRRPMQPAAATSSTQASDAALG